MSASIVIEDPKETAPPFERPVPAVTVTEELARSAFATEPLTIILLSIPLTLNSVPTSCKPVPAVYSVLLSVLVTVTVLLAVLYATVVAPAPVNLT